MSYIRKPIESNKACKEGPGDVHAIARWMEDHRMQSVELDLGQDVSALRSAFREHVPNPKIAWAGHTVVRECFNDHHEDNVKLPKKYSSHHTVELMSTTVYKASDAPEPVAIDLETLDEVRDGVYRVRSLFGGTSFHEVAFTPCAEWLEPEYPVTHVIPINSSGAAGVGYFGLRGTLDENRKWQFDNGLQNILDPRV